jgi:hypothetical protein
MHPPAVQDCPNNALHLAASGTQESRMKPVMKRSESIASFPARLNQLVQSFERLGILALPGGLSQRGSVRCSAPLMASVRGKA